MGLGFCLGANGCAVMETGDGMYSGCVGKKRLFTFKNMYFFFGCAGSSLLHASFSLVVVSGGSSLVAGCGLLTAVASLAKLGFQVAPGSVVAACGLSSCGPQTQLLLGTWDLPRPRIKPVSPALAGRFPTTEPAGRSLVHFFA